MKISSGATSPVQQIKDRLSIEEVISSYIKLEQSGSNFKARCPFHNEKTPSFFVSKERGNYYCFGCAAKGDIFTFVEEFEGLDFKGALKILAERAGVKLGEFSKEKEGEKERLYKIMEEAAKFFEKNLAEVPSVIKYLKDRGLEEKTIKDFRIGYIKSDWRLLYSYLQKNGFTDAEIENAGLIKKIDKPMSDGRKGYYDRFRGRVMFPINDSSGRVIAFTGRLFIDDGKSAKYLNSPDTLIFKKSSVLYGIDKAKDSIRKNNFSIVVEGQFDLILSHQAGYKNTIATSGTALTDKEKSEDNIVNNLGVVSRLSQNIIFIFDSDKAGFNASIRATPIALALFSDMNVKATEIPEGMDPADLISKKGVNAWREVIKNSKHIIEFLLDRFILVNKENDPLKTKLEIDNKVIPYVSLINNSIKKSHFISLISSRTGISEDDIRTKIKKIEQEFKNEKQEIEKAKEVELKLFRKDYIERRILGIILWQKELLGKGNSAIDFDFDKIIKEFSEIIGLKENEILEKVKDKKEDLIFEAEVFYGGGVDLKKDTEELLLNFKEEYLKEELFKKMQELRNFENKKEFIKSNEILKEINEINKSIQNIKNGRKN